MSGGPSNSAPVDFAVVIVGGGPVGLTLAIDLGQRGIDCLLLEKRDAPAFLPKMERCHSRTMEHFRRLGLGEEIRAAGWPEELPLDSFLVNSLSEPPLMRDERPSVAELKALSHKCNDGSQPAEPYHIISQYTLEPLLKRHAESLDRVQVRFGCEVVSVTERPDRVEVSYLDPEGTRVTVACSYLVGCDGGSSDVRKWIGASLEGDANVGELVQSLIRADDLFGQIPIGQGAHYHVADDQWTFLIVQDDRRHFSLHTRTDDLDAIPEIFERVVGFPTTYEVLFTGPWTMRLMLADSYGTCRVFLAGDAAHLVTPIGGLGMNTGIGDVVDLAWKLAAVLSGWGGTGLLESYKHERRQVGARNVAAATRAYRARRAWRDLYETGSTLGTEQKSATALREHRRGREVDGVILGYRYWDSAVVIGEPHDDGADQREVQYVPSVRPGIRLPHVWLSSGDAIQDVLRRDRFSLLRLADDADAAPLLGAFEAAGVPLEVVDLTREPSAAATYGTGLVLVRPDMHVVWHNSLPSMTPAELVGRVCGRLPRSSD